MSAPFQRRITRGLGHAGGGPHPYLVSVKVNGFSTQPQATRGDFGTIPPRTWLQPRVHRAGPEPTAHYEL